jgi:phosphate acyltransferase
LKIAIDCMGGDSPAVWRNVMGAFKAYSGASAEVILVGDKSAIEEEIKKLPPGKADFEIVHASEVVGMDEAPASALRKKRDSSLWKIFQLVNEGSADGAVTAGNTGAAMAMAKIQLGMLPFVDKPAIAVPIPGASGVVTLLDAGANVDCKPKHLLQFAVMGWIYAENVYRIENPVVGILNIGEEKSKGNELTKEAYKLLENSPVPFCGNVEGKDVFSGRADIVVCDGFVGNIVLKVAESFSEVLEKILISELKSSFSGRVGGLLLKRGYKSFKKKMSSSSYGGAPLLGINGVCVIAHGSSSPEAIENAVYTAKDFAETGINSRMEKALRDNERVQI